MIDNLSIGFHLDYVDITFSRWDITAEENELIYEFLRGDRSFLFKGWYFVHIFD